jgi:phosphoglycerate dehydrogenase-like enzyme
MTSPVVVAVHARFGRQAIVDRIAAMAGVEVIPAESADELIAAIRRADVLALTNPARAEGAMISAALNGAGSRVVWIQAMSAGFDGLLDQPIPEGLQVVGQGGAMASPVAEHAVGLLLGLQRGLFEIGLRSRERRWDRDFAPPLAALEGRTVAIIGFGNIGRAVARRLRAFDMRILAVSRTRPAVGEADAYFPLDALHEALGQADAVILSIALAEGTRLLFDAQAFAACKPGAAFINVARGELVDQRALAAALVRGHLSGAAIDVASPEPLPLEDPLWQAPRLWVSPHVAGAGSPLAAKRIAQSFGENLERHLAGLPLVGRLR